MFFFFNDTATTEIYTLSLHDALPILCTPSCPATERGVARVTEEARAGEPDGSGRRADRPVAQDGPRDRKSTRLNSSHANISYAVFCLKKKKKQHYLLLIHIVHIYTNF